MFETIPQFLLHWANEHPEQPALHVQDSESDWRILSWAELLKLSLSQATQLSKQGIKLYDRVLLLDLEPHLNIPTLFALWIIGATPLQMALPPKFETHDLAIILERWHCQWALNSWLKPLKHKQVIEVRDWSVPTDSPEEIAPERLQSNPNLLAFLQLTSGSTGSPRAVAISEQRLCKHLAAMSLALPPGPQPLTVSWLPLYHDMGLVGGLLYTLFNGSTLVTTSPKAFQRWPFIWPQLLSDHRASITVAPPSAYALLARLAPRIRRQGLDLSSLHQFVMGASPIPATVIRALKESLGPCGLKDTVMVPAYGMAEATLAISFPEPHCLPFIDSIEKEPFESKRRAIPGKELEFVSCGQAIAGTMLRIIDKDGRPLKDRFIGEIQIRSESLMLGYTTGKQIQSLDNNEWFSTGDLGYLAEGHLFVSGRSKELIICNGRNFFPDNVELTASQHPKIKSGTVAAIGVNTEDKSNQLIVLVLESRFEKDQQQELARDVQQFMESQLIPVTRIAFTAPGTLPRTTSGKLKRTQLLENIERLSFADLSPKKKSSFFDSLVKKQIPSTAPETRSQIAQFILERLKSALPVFSQQFNSQATLIELGADSLTRSDLQFQMESHLNIDLPIGLFDSDKSVNEIAAICSELKKQSPELPQQLPQTSAQSIPFSPLQWRFLFSPKKPERRAEITLHLRCPRDLSVEALASSLNWLAVRHQALCLRLRSEKEGWIQYEGDAGSSVHFEKVAIPPETSMAELGFQTVLDLCSKLNIEEGPNLCAGLISKDETQSVLILVLNHFVCDGWSIAILLSDLEKAYRAYSMGQKPDLHQVPGQARFSDWTRALKVLARQSKLGLFERPETEDQRGSELWKITDKVTFTESQRRTLGESFLSDRERHLFLLTIFLRAWSEVTGRASGFVQLEVHGRGQLGALDSRRTVGWLALRYPFPFTMNSGFSLEEQLGHWREQLDLMPHSGLEYCAKETYCLDPERRVIPEIQFNLRGQSFENPNKLGLFPAIRSSSRDNFRRLGDAALGLTVVYKKSATYYYFIYDPELVECNTVKSLETCFVKHLETHLGE